MIIFVIIAISWPLNYFFLIIIIERPIYRLLRERSIYCLRIPLTLIMLELF